MKTAKGETGKLLIGVMVITDRGLYSADVKECVICTKKVLVAAEVPIATDKAAIDSMVDYQDASGREWMVYGRDRG